MGGYTIVEVMIFLVVSTALFGVVASISQQGQRNNFPRTINQVQDAFQDVLNDTSTGYYPSADDFSCVATPLGPSLSSGTVAEKGTNSDCLFMGKAVQFGPNSKTDQYNVYNIVGNRLGTDITNNGKEVKTVGESKPVVLGVSGRPGIFDTNTIPYGVLVTKIFPVADPATTVGGFVIVPDLSQSVLINNSVTGNASRVNLGIIRNTSLTNTETSFTDAIHDATNIDTSIASSGIVICMQEDGSGGGRKASITIGGGGRQLSLSQTIDTWPGGCN